MVSSFWALVKCDPARVPPLCLIRSWGIMQSKMKRKKGIILIGIAYSGFIILGMPDGLLGVAWPSIRESFNISLDALGTLLIATMIGYFLSSFNSGRLVSRMGLGSLLMVSSIIRGVGLLGCALSPTWWVMVLSGLLAGIGGGVIDAGGNTYVATNHSAGLLNWLHASWGLGAAFGPLIMTAVLSMGQSWRWGYVIVGIVQGLFAVCYGLTLGAWHFGSARHLGSEPKSKPGSPADRVSSGDTLRLPVVWFSIVLFFIYTGLEGATGQWTYSLFTEARSVALSTAGLWISVFWTSFTVGRLVAGVVVDRMGLLPLLRMSILGAMCGAILVWWNATNLLGFLGLALMGLSFGPIFPLLIADTPGRLGAEHAANAIGFQIGAASLGIGIMPGIAGVLAENLGLEIIGPFLLAGSIVVFLLNEAITPRG